MWMIVKDQIFNLYHMNRRKHVAMIPACIQFFLSLQAIHISQNLRQQWLQEASPHHTETTHAPHKLYIQIVHSNHNTCINIHTARNSLTHCFLFASVWTQKNLHNQELPRGSKRSMASLSTRTRCVSRRLRSKARCTCGWPGCNEEWLSCRT